MSRSNRSAGGYGRPPVDHQFKPGQSGNPSGRPKGAKNLATTLLGVLNGKVTVRDKNGPRTLSKLQVMFEVMTNKAIAGDPRAFGQIVQIAAGITESAWSPPVNHRAILDDAYLKIQEGLDRIAKGKEREQEQTRTSQVTEQRTNTKQTE